MKDYDLGFISNENITEHVRNTVMQYSRSIIRALNSIEP